MNLTQAVRASGVSRNKLVELIQTGRLEATKESRTWMIDPASLARVTGLPDVMERQERADERIVSLEKTVAGLVAWQTDAAATIAFLTQHVTGKRISRRQLVAWLGEHGFNAEAWMHIKDIDRHVHHDRPLNQQDDVLVFATLRVINNRGRFADTQIHENSDPECCCHTVLPDLHIPPTL